MNRCARSGYLVNGTATLPVDPSDFCLEELPVVGCSRLRCRGCGAVVRNATGLSFKNKNDVAATVLASLYEQENLHGSDLLMATQPNFRLYLCKCQRWLEVSEHACAEPDPNLLSDPTMPWSCDGHSQLELPAVIDGVSVESNYALRDLVTRFLRGFVVPGARANEERASWLVRLHARLHPIHVPVVVEAARLAVDDPDAKTRGLALDFFIHVADEGAQRRLLSMFRGNRAMFDVPDTVTSVPHLDRTLAETAWRVVAKRADVDATVRLLAREEALQGRGSRALYDLLARTDSQWVVENAEILARATPSRAKDLSGSFALFPQGVPIRSTRDRVQKAIDSV